jgi:hypothetical protein
MDSITSRKIIVASSMAVVVGIGLVIFAVRVHSGTYVAQTPHPPTPFAETPAVAPAATAELPAAPAAAAEIPAAPAPVAQVPVAPAAVAPSSVSSPAVDQKVGTSTGLAASDNQITTDVKSGIAGDSLSKDVNIGVTTTRGVVALTGSLASQDAIDHFKDVAGKVPGVKSVDASALVLASL